MFRCNCISVEQISYIARSSDVRSSSFAEQAMWKNCRSLEAVPRKSVSSLVKRVIGGKAGGKS